MTDHVKIIAGATRSFAEHQTWTDERDVLLGDYQGNVIALNSIYPRTIKWHNLPGEIHEQGIAILSTDTNVLYQENAAYVDNPPRITIGKPPRSDKNAPYFVKGGSTSLEGMKSQGNLSQVDQIIGLIGNPHIYNIVDFRVRPTDTVSSSVHVETGYYERLSAPGVKRLYPSGSYDLATYINLLASGKHQLALIYMDKETEALGAALTAPSTAAGTLPSRLELSDLTSIRLLSRQKELGVAYLYYGQTTIVQSDCLSILDPRLTRPEQPGLTSAIFRNGMMMSRLSKAVYL